MELSSFLEKSFIISVLEDINKTAFSLSSNDTLEKRIKLFLKEILFSFLYFAPFDVVEFSNSSIIDSLTFLDFGQSEII